MVTAETECLALEARGVEHSYGEHVALRGLDLSVHGGEIFGLLGPNGSGKTTLFRLISTLAKVQRGAITVFGRDVSTSRAAVRGSLGVVFQTASLDPKLTVEENIRCQAALYGLSGRPLKHRIDEVASALGIQDRLRTRADELSGGLKRRAELAKGILHRPRLLLMDEPSTGLDPAARLDMWHAIQRLRDESRVTVLLTTHLLEEADKADRIAIMHQGLSVAVGEPSRLRSELGEQVLSISSKDSKAVVAWLHGRGIETQSVANQLRVVGAQASSLVAPLADEFGDRIQMLSLGQPSLEDVFIAKTGHQYWAS